ncbi:pepsin-like aspartyl protease [Pelomonas sp. KK5]|uniref:pepsin-like aspartyl protease n=1 Tax=Pelomonas sp. KK5 TaxID=1855730 RepID=UPI0009F83919|nr:pepsin-like aspartyl protease [Pelomonas sp. KK5]
MSAVVFERAAHPVLLRQHPATRLRWPARRGPYQDNGASPWYSTVRIGSGAGARELKLNIDTGARFSWVMLAECESEACMMPARRLFEPAASPSYRGQGGEPLRIDFGHWGEMRARPGSELLALPDDSAALRLRLHGAIRCDGEQFCELNWDGGLGIPNGLSPDPHATHLVEALLNAGLLAPEDAFVSFLMDPASGTGTVEIGRYDSAAVDPSSAVELPFSPYVDGLDYIWTTPLRSWRVGAVEVARDVLFCHDTGASHFKGDPLLLAEALRQVGLQHERDGQPPALSLSVGRHRASGRPATLVLEPGQYLGEIEAGHGQGQATANLQPLAGYDGLVLAGSVLLDHVCTVYRFEVSGSPGRYRVSPGTTLMFNKRGGPKVIR